VHYENLRTDAYGSKWKEYKAIVLKFRGRALDDELFISAHATFSSVEGLANDLSNIGTYGTNPLQRYDNAEEWWGPVSTMRSREMSDADPTFTFRLNGTYYLFNWLYVSMFLNLDNNYLPYTWDKKSVSGFGKVVYYPNGRGDLERLPFFHDLAFQFGIEEEIHLPFGWDFLGEVVSLGVYINIDNVTSDQSYYQIDTFARSSTYGDPTKWRSARSYMLGFRLEF
jgi:hypothetical protein